MFGAHDSLNLELGYIFCHCTLLFPSLTIYFLCLEVITTGFFENCMWPGKALTVGQDRFPWEGWFHSIFAWVLEGLWNDRVSMYSTRTYAFCIRSTDNLTYYTICWICLRYTYLEHYILVQDLILSLRIDRGSMQIVKHQMIYSPEKKNNSHITIWGYESLIKMWSSHSVGRWPPLHHVPPTLLGSNWLFSFKLCRPGLASAHPPILVQYTQKSYTKICQFLCIFPRIDS